MANSNHKYDSLFNNDEFVEFQNETISRFRGIATMDKIKAYYISININNQEYMNSINLNILNLINDYIKEHPDDFTDAIKKKI